MKTTLRRPALQAMAAFLVLFSTASQAQITDPPTPLAGTAITADSFIANWEPVPAATSYRLDVSTSPTFGDPIFASDLIISEYVEGGPGYKAIEIYNGTGAAINLATGGYRLRKQQDGTGAFDQMLITGVIPHGSAWVATFTGPAPGIAAVANLTNITVGGAMDFDGNDAVMLMKNGVAIDVVGVMDQTTNWGADMTLRRKASVNGPTTTYSINDWDAYPMNDIADIGMHTMTDFAPSFVPGYEDLTVNGTSQLVSGLAENTDYYYRVRAVGPDGTSVNSTPTIHVRTLAVSVFGSIVQAPGIACQDTAATFNLTGLTPNSTYTISYNIDGGPTQTATGVVVDGSGLAAFGVVLGLANNGQTLTVTAVERTDVPSTIEPVTTNNTVVLSVTASATYYADTDSDGYGDAGNTIQLCQATPGFVLDNTDCDDSRAAIHPGATEILFNGVDDNCDGNLDEGGQYVTQIQASQCGAMLSTIYAFVRATSLSNATMYRFEVTDLGTSEIQVLDRTKNYFTLTMLPSYHYDTTYSVRIMVQYNGVWLGYYGPTCNVSSPYVLVPGGAAMVNPSQCGSVLPTIDTHIETTSLHNATGYRFRVTNVSDPSAPNQVQIIDRSIQWFALTMLPSYNYGATYTVEVAIRTTGDYSSYGSPCSVSAPPAPSLTNCGVVVATSASKITTASKDHVTMYQFIVTNVENNDVTIIDRQQNWFTFNYVPGYVPGALYDVKVAVMTTGYYSLPGEGCQITAPAAVARIGNTETDNDTEEIAFEAKAYPNPFSGSFSLKVTTASESDFSIKVYDMTGRLIEDRKAAPSDVQTLTLGESYPAGVYNVIILQGESVETLRVIRR